MNAPPVSANNVPLVSRSAAGEAVARALRAYIGRGSRFSVREVEAATGVPARSIECAMIFDCDNPDWRRLPQEHLLALCSWLGPGFTTMLLAKTAQQGAYHLPEGDPGEASMVTTMRAAVDLAGGGNHHVVRAAALHLAGKCGQVLRAAA